MKEYLKPLKSWIPYLFLTLLCFALYLPGISTIPVDDRDSAHFAQATRQMLETGNYFQIRYQDVTRFQKPPGINWLQAISVKAFSSPESTSIWPYRVPSLIGGWLSVLLLFAFAKRLCGLFIAFIAATGLASTLLLNFESHLAVIDSSLLSSVVLMQGALWIVYDQSKHGKKVHWKWGILFFLSMAYGFLLKGVTPLVGFLTLLTLSFLDRTTLYFKALRWKWGILLLFLLSAGWLIAVSCAEHSNYLMQMLHKDLFPKLAGAHESHGAPFGTHLALLIITFWPLSFFLWPTMVRTWKYRNETSERFLLAWIIPVWIFFELMPTKLPQYILPIFPALALLTAYAIRNETTKNTRILHFLAFFWGLITIGLASAFVAIPILLHLPVNWVAIAITAILTIASITAISFIFRKNITQSFSKAFITLIIGNLLAFSLAFQWFLPSLSPVWSSNIIVEMLNKEIPGKITRQHPLFVSGYGEPSLVFLLGTNTIRFNNTETNIPEILGKLKDSSSSSLHEAKEKQEYALIELGIQQNFINQAAAQGLAVNPIKTIQCFNYSKGHWLVFTLYRITVL